jgi:hypothetical protein
MQGIVDPSFQLLAEYLSIISDTNVIARPIPGHYLWKYLTASLFRIICQLY